MKLILAVLAIAAVIGIALFFTGQATPPVQSASTPETIIEVPASAIATATSSARIPPAAKPTAAQDDIPNPLSLPVTPPPNPENELSDIANLAKGCQAPAEIQLEFDQWLFELQAVAAEFLASGNGSADELIAAAIYVTDARTKDRLDTFTSLLDKEPNNPYFAERVLRECAILRSVCPVELVTQASTIANESLMSRLAQARYHINNSNPEAAIEHLLLAATAPELGDRFNNDLAIIAQFSEDHAINARLGRGQVRLWRALAQDSSRYYLSSMSELSDLCLNTQTGAFQTTCGEIGRRLADDSESMMGKVLGNILQAMGDPDVVDPQVGFERASIQGFTEEIENFAYDAEALSKIAANDPDLLNYWWQAQLAEGDFNAITSSVNYALEKANAGDYRPCERNLYED